MRITSISVNHRVTLLSVMVLPVLLALGNWQLNRAEEKREIQEKLAQRVQQAPKAIESLDIDSDLAFMPVKLSGTFDNLHNFLLDNRVNSGKVGYDVLSPFLTIEGTWVLVNRGWIEAPALRSEKPEIPVVHDGETISVLASVYVMPGKPFQLEEQQFQNVEWPLVIQVVDPLKLGALLDRDFFKYELRLDATEIGALDAEWQAINVQPEKHTAYAVQWFAMAAALIIWFIFANTTIKQLFSKPKDK